ncbi:MBL fold metallo-hydrolase [Archangium minus]
MKLLWTAGFALVSLLVFLSPRAEASAANRVTILYDGFGKPSDLRKDWGFAALIEYEGKRILFDTGNNPEHFAHNVQRLGVDLTDLDFVVISHRHGDHASGLKHLLEVNPDVPIYVPADEYFGGVTPPHFFEHGDASLPPEMRYFDGHPPHDNPHGTPWREANFIRVTAPLEVAPGLRLITTTSQKRGTMELKELSLVIETPSGKVLVAGCSHPGIEPILQEAARSSSTSRFRMLFGGLHLVEASDAEVQATVSSLLDTWRIQELAPGHCSGERTFALLRSRLGQRHVFAGVGTSIPL